MKLLSHFKLFVPAAYGSSLTVSNADGSTGETVRSDQCLSKSRLPDFCERIFTVPTLLAGTRAQNFYHMGSYLVASGQVLDMLLERSTSSVETAPIRVVREDGMPVSEQYFVVASSNAIECIEPERSTWSRRYSHEKSYKTFSEYPFANGSAGDNVVYPSRKDFAIRTVTLSEDRIPPGIVLFQPMYWPGHWIIEADFARDLERSCAGGSPGYYFWALDLNDAEGSYYSLMHSLR